MNLISWSHWASSFPAGKVEDIQGTERGLVSKAKRELPETTRKKQKGRGVGREGGLEGGQKEQRERRREGGQSSPNTGCHKEPFLLKQTQFPTVSTSWASVGIKQVCS